MTSRHWLCGSAIVLLLAALAAIPADAQRRDRDRDRDRDREQTEERCKRELIKASGNAVWRPFSRKRELAGEGAAMQNAIANWQRQVRSKYGEQWMVWDRSGDPEQGRDLRKDCVAASIGTIGRNVIRCTITGYPCKEVLDPGGSRPDPRPDRRCDYSEWDVREAQRLLNSCRRECDAAVDGILGDHTRGCLERFQRRYNLERTGEPCRETMRELRRHCGSSGGYRDRR